MDGGLARRRWTRCAAALTAMFVITAAGAALSAAAPSAAAAASVTTDITTSSQKQILTNDRVRVNVTSNRSRQVTVRGSLDGAGMIVTTRTLTAPRGTRAVVLRLTSTGRKRVADCTEGRRLRVTATFGNPRHVARDAAELVIDTRACDEPVGGTSPGPTISNPERCDFLDGAVCLQPWPNDYFTVADASTDTGRRLNLSSDSTPKNQAGKAIDPTDINRADGFSPGNLIVTKVPGLDNQAAFQNTGAVPITDMDRYADANQPIVLINAATGKRHPVWSELDANPANASDVNLIIRPSVNLAEGARYIVALRNLKNASGGTIEPSEAFKVYRDRLITPQQPIEARRQHMEDLFHRLQDSGVKRKNLYLAWDFTVASEESLAGRALSIRDDAFAVLGDTDLGDLQVQGSSPQFAVTSTTNFDPCGTDGCQDAGFEGDPTAGAVCDLLNALASVTNLIALGTLLNCADLPGSTPAESNEIARRVEGQVVVPCYLDESGCPQGSKFSLDAAGKPQRLPGNTTLANFICNIPRSAVDGGVDPARPSLYGHGLIGSAGEVNGGNVRAMSNENNVMFCATDWAGFSSKDIPTILLNLQDLSLFNTFIDHMLQGYLNQMYLGRTMIHAAGFSGNDAFKVGGQSVIDTERLFYDGNSQGGIMGGALTALAPDFDRAALGVPGMNYSTLLQRSSDFAPYAEGRFRGAVCDELPAELQDACEQIPEDSNAGLYDNYPNEIERPLIFSLMQLLWDRGEANGYAHHMTTDPLPNTPPHEVLLHVAFGDHQVADVTAATEARTIGARLLTPALDPGRSIKDDTFGLQPIPSFPFGGSALVYWDGGPKSFPGGTDPALNTNMPPGPAQGGDPHSYPRNTFEARVQKSAFMMVDGRVINVCGSHPCYSHGYTGP